MRCVLLQCNTKVGDIEGNLGLVLEGMTRAAARGANLLVTPELAITGYPPRDLLLYPAFVEAAEAALLKVAEATGVLGLDVVVGSVGLNGEPAGKLLGNQAIFCSEGRVVTRYNKRLLPFYDVFDEGRYFEPGREPCVINCKGRRVALTVCEDIWNDEAFWPRRNYPVDPLADMPTFDLLLNLSASPFTAGKQATRERMLAAVAARYGSPVLYVNLIGGNDDLIFDGRSMIVGPDGSLAARGKDFGEDLLFYDCDGGPFHRLAGEAGPDEEVLSALTLGVRDYCAKSGLRKALLGLSGGIDSALTAVIACAALGAENVLGVLMPSPYSSSHSVSDAEELAANLGMKTLRLPIAEAMRAFEGILAPSFAGYAPDATEENIQARIRGILLMALSNKFGALVLSTGNKSELSVGYCTIYGDMCGGLSVIGDLYKTEVFRLCRLINEERGGIIPENILSKPPSAELRPDQKDEDSLPPYAKLDDILRNLAEERLSVSAVGGDTHSADTARKVAELMCRAEFKRRQGAPVLKISGNAFGLGWRMPLACAQAYLL